MRFFAGDFTLKNQSIMNRYCFGLFLCVVACFMVSTTRAQEFFKGKRNLYIVRHAEKDTGSNPPLTQGGKKRAGDLYSMLKNKKIDVIFTSNYKRTIMTADSLRQAIKIDTVMYTPDVSGEKLFQRIEERAGDAKNILIIGHSNTLPGIIRKAGVTTYTVKELPDSEYDNLFVIEQNKGKLRFKQLKYGDPSPVSKNNAPSMQMQ